MLCDGNKGKTEDGGGTTRGRRGCFKHEIPVMGAPGLEKWIPNSHEA